MSGRNANEPELDYYNSSLPPFITSPEDDCKQEGTESMVGCGRLYYPILCIFVDTADTSKTVIVLSLTQIPYPISIRYSIRYSISEIYRQLIWARIYRLPSQRFSAQAVINNFHGYQLFSANLHICRKVPFKRFPRLPLPSILRCQPCSDCGGWIRCCSCCCRRKTDGVWPHPKVFASPSRSKQRGRFWHCATGGETCWIGSCGPNNWSGRSTAAVGCFCRPACCVTRNCAQVGLAGTWVYAPVRVFWPVLGAAVPEEAHQTVQPQAIRAWSCACVFCAAQMVFSCCAARRPCRGPCFGPAPTRPRSYQKRRWFG